METWLPERLKELRIEHNRTQDEMAKAIGLSQPTYMRIESGSRPLKGTELIQLADSLGIRVAAITGLERVQAQAKYAARTDGSNAGMDTMRNKLYAYLELDDYLNDQGIE